MHSSFKYPSSSAEGIQIILAKFEATFRSTKRMAKQDEVKLIGVWASAYVTRAMIALNLKGVEYEYLEDDLFNKSELLLKSNPVYKLVPVLIHGDKPVCESRNIVEYIDQVWDSSGPSILPADPYDRAIARFWAAYVDDKLAPPNRVLVWSKDEKSIAEAKEQLLAALLQLEEAFVKCSKGKSFFGGDTINLVDITLGSFLTWLQAFEIITGTNFLDKTKTPRLVEWAECFRSVDAVKEVLPEAEKLVEFRKYAQAARRIQIILAKFETTFRSTKRMAKQDEVKLIGVSASAYVTRAMIALNLKGVEYEYLADDLFNKSELLLKSNPVYKTVPVLIHGDKPVCESLIIVEYIDQVWASSGPSILPADPYDRAIARFWAAYVDSKFAPHHRVLVRSNDEKSIAEAKEQLFAALLQLEEAFVECSKGKSFFGGDTINLVDITLGSFLSWLQAFEIITGTNFLDKTKTPRLVEWAECFRSVDAAKEVLPEAEKLVEYRKFSQAARRVTVADAAAK
ncbi:hypothetical protein IEQ34_014184 [Dendrobium chrysotoxum]|uniref:glutathione transferase n=1 Tax=Dendrobium chrysotoxum TaxID=161865 RepID=A0AAV7GK01_DENCH|nr:hypothetical protein IEQ34_014184 [Dendrobium chrysotoxum]